jgi:HEAT repeat protein
MPVDPQRPSAETIEWAKALVAAGLTDDVVAELLELVRVGTDDRAEMAAWALAYGDIPPHLKIATLQSLLGVLVDTARQPEVRGQVAEAFAQEFEFAEDTDPLRQAAELALIDLLDDESAIVRFWAAFGLGSLKARRALPLLRALTSDDTFVPRWWTVGEEAADAVERVEGRVPPERVGRQNATADAADPADESRADDAG